MLDCKLPPSSHPKERMVEAVSTILCEPEDQLDYARAKLALDELVDPALDSARAESELDRLAAAADRMAGPNADAARKLAAVRKVIYDSGPWNDYRPFAYDHDDPLGTHLPNKLLANYLTTRRGQCVSMPILFLILADRLGVRLSLARAPCHAFIRFEPPGAAPINIETTSGGYPARLEWFRKNFPMSDRALASGLYMRSLSNREGVALMATTVLEYLLEKQRYEEAIALCRLILDVDPSAGEVLVSASAACAHLIDRQFVRKYPVPALIPELLRPCYLDLCKQRDNFILAARRLGWEPEPQDIQAE